MKIIEQPIHKEELTTMAQGQFGEYVKAVVDIRRKVMAVGGELHADEEGLLIEHGSKQTDLWGINIFPEKSPNQRVEFDSMINIKPAQGNRTRRVEDEKIRSSIIEVVNQLIA